MALGIHPPNSFGYLCVERATTVPLIQCPVAGLPQPPPAPARE